MKIIITFLFITCFFNFAYSQDDIQIGSQGATGNQNGGLFDYSDPSAVNIKVQLWGYVEFPGFYIIPSGFSINELISLAGGPTQDALINDIRVVKLREGAKTVMVKYDYNDMMWEENINTQINYVRLDAGDIVVVPGEPRYFVRQDIAFYLGIVTTLASLAALIISIIYASN